MSAKTKAVTNALPRLDKAVRDVMLMVDHYQDTAVLVSDDAVWALMHTYTEQRKELLHNLTTIIRLADDIEYAAETSHLA